MEISLRGSLWAERCTYYLNSGWIDGETMDGAHDAFFAPYDEMNRLPESRQAS